MRKGLLLSLFTICSLSVFASGNPEERKPEKTNKKMAQPDVPGTLVIDFGLNILQNNSPEIKTDLLGSRSINLYYFRDYRILKSNFFFLAGLGVGLDRYKFDNDVTISKATIDGANVTELVPIVGADVKKSMLVTNYVDLPVELRFHGNPSDTKRSFKAGVGFKVGYLFNSHTKIKKEQNGDLYKEKVNNDFYLNYLRYGVTGRIGIGGFNVFFYKSLNTLWRSGRGPDGNEANNATIGVSFTGF